MRWTDRMSSDMREWLIANNTTLESIARRCGFRAESLSKYARGGTMPPASKLKKIADVMGVSLDDAYYLFIDSREV